MPSVGGNGLISSSLFLQALVGFKTEIWETPQRGKTRWLPALSTDRMGTLLSCKASEFPEGYKELPPSEKACC